MLAGHQRDRPHRVQAPEGKNVHRLLIHLSMDRLLKISLLPHQHFALDEEHVVHAVLVVHELEADVLLVLLVEGENDGKFRTDILFTLDPDAATHFLYNIVAVGKPKACAASRSLGGEERGENLAHVLLGDPAAGITDLHLDKAILFHATEGEFAIAVHRLDGIDDEVEEELLKLSLIGLNGGKCMIIALDTNVLRIDTAKCKPQRELQHPDNLHLLGLLHLLLAAVDGKLLDDIAGSF
ncbi:hypothetical protein DSECCO2_644210 [anaerobic digester metagenome]